MSDAIERLRMLAAYRGNDHAGWYTSDDARAILTELAAKDAEIEKLREVARDAVKALPVLITMLKSAGLPMGQIVGEGMLANARAALGGGHE